MNPTPRVTRACHSKRGCTRRITRTSGRRFSQKLEWCDLARGTNALVNTPQSLSQPDAVRSHLLHDCRIVVKDNICTASMPTTCSSAMLKGFIPPFDATVVGILRNAGACLVGKTNCDEFGMGSLNIHSMYGPVINPHQVASSNVPWVDREKRYAGGSSGGSAAAVAANLCDVALSTDTGGSTRLPASYCGIVGLKPSYGLISRWGVVSFADSLDCVGIMAKTTGLVKRVFHIVSQHDHKDPTAATPNTRQKAAAICQDQLHRVSGGNNGLASLRIGVPQEYFPSELDPSVLGPIRRVLTSLKARGAALIPVSLPSTYYALSAYYVIASAEASSNMARYDGIQYGLHVPPPSGSDQTKNANVYAHTRSQGFGREVQKRILLGTYALTADAFDNYFLQAQKVRQLIRSDFEQVFRIPNVLSTSTSPEPPEGVDVLIHPSAIRTAPLLSDGLTGLESYVQDVLTVPASLAGLPALSVPAGLAEDGWPVGVSIVGQWGFDRMVLRIGEIVEQCDNL